jgi:crotonobetainyl-CoA:carnitine CoA-transferase CaiB-like acyl-CoA transferase
MLSGPYATMLLADLGAETIKIEPPGKGEGTRRLLERDPRNSIEGMGAYFLTLGRNKKSVALDLKSPEGLELFYALVEKSDVVAYNFSAGVAERLGIDHGKLEARNPAIVSASITGFGETGPHKDWSAFDMVAQGTGGGMSITGAPGGEPLRAGIPIGDLGGGLMATIGILSALTARVRTGRGQHVDVSMQDAQISMLNYMATMYFLSGDVPGPLGNGHFVHVPYGTYPCADGYLILALIADQFWPPLLQIVELPELDTEDHKHQPGRLRDKAEIDAALSAKLRTKPRDHWLERLRAARIPCAPVNDLRDVFADPHVAARGMIVEVAHPSGRTVKQPGNPIKLSKTNEETFAPPPLVGAHTAEILGGLLGKSATELETLRGRGIIG